MVIKPWIAFNLNQESVFKTCHQATQGTLTVQQSRIRVTLHTIRLDRITIGYNTVIVVCWHTVFFKLQGAVIDFSIGSFWSDTAMCRLQAGQICIFIVSMT